MSPDLEQMLGRAVADKAFRDGLLIDPAGAIKAAGFNLSAEEIKRVVDSVDALRAKNASVITDFDQAFGSGGALAW